MSEKPTRETPQTIMKQAADQACAEIREIFRKCTCHPDDIDPPCEQKYALTECRIARLERERDEARAERDALREALRECVEHLRRALNTVEAEGWSVDAEEAAIEKYRALLGKGAG